MRSSENKELEEFKRLLEKTTPGDFDGHTDFEKLSPEERLVWLGQCARFFAAIETR